MHKLIYPDYKNCIANLPNSIVKYFGGEPVGDTLPMLKPYLKKGRSPATAISTKNAASSGRARKKPSTTK